MSTCPSCSIDVSPPDVICQSCGASLATAPAATAPPDAPRRRNRRRLINALLICTVGIASCAGALYPYVQQARESALRSNCNCVLKQLGLALHTYHDDYGSFPPAFVRGPDGRPWHSWRVLVLPYLDGAGLYSRYNFAEPWDGPNNIKLLAEMPFVFDCPTRQEAGGASRFPLAATRILACGSGLRRPGMTTSYAAVFGSHSVFRGSEPVTIKDICDGTSSTVMVGELTNARILWTKPEDIDVSHHSRIGDPLGFSSSGRDGGTYFLMADGSVRRVYPSTPQQTIDALFTRDGGETVEDF